MKTVIKAAVAYLIVLFVIRIVGRRTASQQAPMDMSVLFMFGGMSVSAVLGDDRSFTGAMSALFTIGLMHVAVSWLKVRFVRLERVVDGTPIVVFRDGRWDETQLRRLSLQQAEVHTACRQQAFDDLGAVAAAVVERDGRISLIGKAGTSKAAFHDGRDGSPVVPRWSRRARLANGMPMVRRRTMVPKRPLPSDRCP